jgi:hypothetical protein
MSSYASSIYMSSKTPSNAGSSGNLDSQSPIFLYKYPNSGSVQELPLPAPQLLSEQESRLEGGRITYVGLPTM